MSGRIAPALRETLHQYSRATFRKDLGAGITVGVIALPLSLALAIASGVPPQHGLYTVVIGALIAALSGGSLYNISGPTAAFVVVLIPVVRQFGLSGLLAAGMLAGILQVLMGAFKLGKLVHMIPYPVVVGFTSGIGMVIALLQLKGLFGLNYPSHAEMTLDKTLELGLHLPQTHPWSLAIGCIVFAVMGLWKFTKSPMPPHLPALFLATAASLALNTWFDAGIATIASAFQFTLPGGALGHGIPAGLPSFQIEPVFSRLQSLANIQALLGPAFAIALLGSLESLLCAVVADRMTGKHHHPNGELIGQGLANLITPFFGGIPVTAAIARTAANVSAGGQTIVASLVHCALILLTLVALGPALNLLPIPALAALLIVTAWKMSEARHFVEIARRAGKSDTLVLIGCFGLTVAFDMVTSVVAGLGMATLLYLVRTIQKASLRHDELAPGVLRIHFDDSLFFGVANQLLENARKIAVPYESIQLDFSHLREVDYTGLESLGNSISEWRKNGKHVELAHASPTLHRQFQEHGLV
ncbi:MAG: hypothetical protein RL318_2885 [Fibrobacterota bacterium]|jgi:SulP family sulfate permease